MAMDPIFKKFGITAEQINNDRYELKIGGHEKPIEITDEQFKAARDILKLSQPVVSAARLASSAATKLLEPAEKFGWMLLRLAKVLPPPAVANLFGIQAKSSIDAIIPENKQGVKNG